MPAAMVSAVLLLLCIIVAQAAPTPLNATSSPTASPAITSSPLPQSRGWVSGSSQRGTWDILVSCGTTMFLCGWTAFHPNVPASRSIWRNACRRVGWIFTTVLLPESVVFFSLNQWWAARRLRDAVNNLGPSAFVDSKSSESNGLRETGSCLGMDRPRAASMDGPRPDLRLSHESRLWTMTDAFFAVAGGYAVRCDQYFHLEYITLTDVGVLELARVGLLPWVSQEEIEDRSKADVLTKILVIVQASWFITQCIARLASKLPLTLLEIHTWTGVVCALAAYCFWFNKPYDVSCPIIFQGELVMDMAALFLAEPCRRSTAYSIPKYLKEEKHSDFESATISLRTIEMAHRVPYPSLYQHIKTTLSIPLLYTLVPAKSALSSWLNRLSTQRHLIGLHRALDPSMNLLVLRIQPSAVDTTMLLEHKRRVDRCIQWLRSRKHCLKWREITVHCRTSGGADLEGKAFVTFAMDNNEACFTTLHSSNMRMGVHEALSESAADAQIDISTMVRVAILLFVLILYGAGHIAAWNAAFPTAVEKLIWRVGALQSAIVPAIFLLYFWNDLVQDYLISRHPASAKVHRLLIDALQANPHTQVIFLLVPVAELIKSFFKHNAHLLAGDQSNIYFTSSPSPSLSFWPGLVSMKEMMTATAYVLRSLVLFCIALYSISLLVLAPILRSFFLVEALASLRSLPSEAFDTVDWTQYFVHAGG